LVAITTEQTAAISPGSQTGAGRPQTRAPRLWIALLAIVLVGLALRIYHIGNHGLFVDEVYSVLVAKGIGDPELIQFDAARPFYFLLLKGWLAFSSDETWMRLLSVIFGTANIVVIYLLGKALGGAKVGFAAAVLTALSPMEIHYSQQVRMYTLGTFLALSGSLALLKAFDTTKRSYLWVWAAARTMMVLTLPLTAVLLLVDGLYAYHHRQGTKLLPLTAVCALVLLVAWSPFLMILLRAQASPYDSWRATLDAPNLTDFLTLLVNFTASAIPLQECGGLPCFDWFTLAYNVIFVPVLGVAVAFCHKQAKMVWCLGWGLIPLTAFLLYSNVFPPLFITRYTMFTAPFVLILLAFGWAEAWTRWRPVGFGIASVYLLAMTSYLSYFYSHPVHEDWRPVAEYIAAHEKPGDQIVIWNYHSRFLLGYYYHGHNQITDMKVLRVNPDDESPTRKLKVQLEFDPKPGQRLWLISRETAPGWARMYHAYGLYKECLGKRFNILHHENLAMTDIFEVTQP
jgi:mannosyltransferase